MLHLLMMRWIVYVLTVRANFNVSHKDAQSLVKLRVFVPWWFQNYKCFKIFSFALCNQEIICISLLNQLLCKRRNHAQEK